MVSFLINSFCVKFVLQLLLLHHIPIILTKRKKSEIHSYFFNFISLNHHQISATTIIVTTIYVRMYLICHCYIVSLKVQQ